MIQITNFTVKKAYEPEGGYKPDAPERELSANIGTKEEPNYITIGKGWIKKDKNNNTYISAALETDRNYQTKAKQDGTPAKTVYVDGWTLVKTKELQFLLNKITNLEDSIPSQSAFTPEEAQIINNARAQHGAQQNKVDEIPF